MKLTTLIFLMGMLICFFPKVSFGQNTNLPKVFVLGEHEEVYEKVAPDYEQLLSTCDNDMRAAFEKWLEMMLEIETFSKTIHYDLHGVKAWIHVFWAEDGTIEHLGFHLKPNSKNIDKDELVAFFSEFIKQYRFPLITEKKYMHYTSVAFPVFYRRIKPTERN